MYHFLKVNNKYLFKFNKKNVLKFNKNYSTSNIVKNASTSTVNGGKDAQFPQSAEVVIIGK